MIDIPNLKIDREGDDPDTNVMLEQDDGAGNVHYVYLHPIHVRLLAERIGLLAASSNIEADRTIRRLCRQMRVLFQRIDQLDDWLNQAQGKGHEDLSMETTYSFATWEMGREFLEELPLDEQGNPPKCGGVSVTNPPKNGPIAGGNPPKSGGVPGQEQLPLAPSRGEP